MLSKIEHSSLEDWKFRESFGNYNDLPPNVERISEDEYICTLINEHIYAIGHYQFIPRRYSEEEFEKIFRNLFNVTKEKISPSMISFQIFIFSDGTGVGIAEASYSYLNEECHCYESVNVHAFVKFAACKHKWISRTIGRSLREEKCEICGFQWIIDSSD